jgi:hypothetical protein
VRHPGTEARHLDVLKWGLLPYWTKDPAKAKRRSTPGLETVLSSAMFVIGFDRARPLRKRLDPTAVDGSTGCGACASAFAAPDRG